MWDERKAIGVLMSACAAELDRRGSTFDDHHLLLHGIARELESLADVLNIERQRQRKPMRWGLLRTYRRVLELPLARTVRSVLTAQLARIERGPQELERLDAA